MKKIVMVVLLALAGLSSAQAQNYVGGSLGYWHKNNGEEKGNQFTIAPEFGMELSERWGWGAELGYSYTHVTDQGDLQSLVINPYVRWTFKKWGIVDLFLDGTFGVSETWTSDENDDSLTGFMFGVKPGIGVKLAPHLKFESKLGFLGYSHDYYNDWNKRAFTCSVSNALTFGLFYTF